MWIWKGQGTEGLPGVPCTDLTDEAFASFAQGYDEQFYPGAMRDSGLWELQSEALPKRKKEVADNGDHE